MLLQAGGTAADSQAKASTPMDASTLKALSAGVDGMPPTPLLPVPSAAANVGGVGTAGACSEGEPGSTTLPARLQGGAAHAVRCKQRLANTTSCMLCTLRMLCHLTR